MRRQFQLPIDIRTMHCTEGSLDAVLAAAPETIRSYVWFISPVGADVINPGLYKVDSEFGEITVKFYRLENEESDEIYKNTKGLVLVADQNGKPLVPTRYLTDNKGQYPCTAVEVSFPYKLEGDLVSTPGKSAGPLDIEKMEVVGLEPMREKVAALLAANRAIKRYGIQKGRAITASEVTALLTVHTKKNPQIALSKTISLVTTDTAFIDAASDYYLGGAKVGFAHALASLRLANPNPPSNETELLALVTSSIDHILIHHIETRRLIDPFWDGAREVRTDSGTITVPKKPKKETEIQPTIQVLLQMALESYGVHVIRESDEGSGNLDFRFSTTTPSSRLISVACEFKLAHHKEIKAGISRQLPRYMDSIPCTHGVFVLMWFKDEKGKFFSEPAGDLDSTKSFLHELASKPINPRHVINARVIDCSIRPSASTLRD